MLDSIYKAWRWPRVVDKVEHNPKNPLEYAKIWRVAQQSAAAANKPVKFGTLSLEPGTYTLNTQPGEKDWQLIGRKLGTPGQWGVPYNAALEIGRATMTLQKGKAPVEQLAISIEDTPKGGTLKVERGTKVVTIPFTVG